jgi:hypothetical protein
MHMRQETSVELGRGVMTATLNSIQQLDKCQTHHCRSLILSTVEAGARKLRSGTHEFPLPPSSAPPAPVGSRGTGVPRKHCGCAGPPPPATPMQYGDRHKLQCPSMLDMAGQGQAYSSVRCPSPCVVRPHLRCSFTAPNLHFWQFLQDKSRPVEKENRTKQNMICARSE